VGRTALTASDHATFRRAIREAATRRFVKHGESGVTMRGVAEELGCSAMTPYRYVRDRDEIFDMVRADAIEGFADAQRRAAATTREPIRRLRALGHAYVDFAIAHPDRYRVMFQLAHLRRESREIAALDLGGWKPMRDTVGEAIAAGLLAGDPDELAHVFWAAMHGLVTLHLANKLRLGRRLDALVDPTLDVLVAGATPRRTSNRKRSR